MIGFDCYKIYIAVKLHFNSNTYDYFFHNKSTRASLGAFEKRNDKAFFHVLGKKYNKPELELFFAANIMENDGIWIGETLEQAARDCYLNYLSKAEALEYTFKQDIRHLKDEVMPGMALIEVPNHSLPTIMTLANQREIEPETLIILNLLYQLFECWDQDRSLKGNYLYTNTKKKLLKYTPFLGKLDLQIYSEIYNKIV